MYKERIILWLVVAEEINELAVATARDFARGIRYNIVGLAGALLGIKRLLQALALLAGARCGGR